MESCKIFLASCSPQRKALLRFLEYPFEVLQIDIVEQRQPHEKPENYVCRLAQQKAAQGLSLLRQPMPVLGADTIVVHEGTVLEKPENKAQACYMLAQLAGQTHQVYTAIALLYPGYQDVRLVTTKVTFCCLTPDEIDAYWQTKEPLNRAGGYAIQGIGGRFVAHIEGSYSAVVGLPLLETNLLIKAWQSQFETRINNVL